jgi:hypothetical protein
MRSYEGGSRKLKITYNRTNNKMIGLDPTLRESNPYPMSLKSPPKHVDDCRRLIPSIPTSWKTYPMFDC